VGVVAVAYYILSRFGIAAIFIMVPVLAVTYISAGVLTLIGLVFGFICLSKLPFSQSTQPTVENNPSSNRSQVPAEPVGQIAMSSPRILKETRFDAVGDGEEQTAGSIIYEIEVGMRQFEVRAFDDEPGGAMVSKPSDAHALAEARSLVDFVVSTIGRDIIQVYSGAEGRYRTIDNQKLEFKRY
jgi:hypothetical protein